MRLRIVSLLVAFSALSLLASGQSAPVTFSATSVGQSTSQTATLVLQSSGTVASIEVLTLGAPGLDFQAAAGGSCALTAYTASQSCTVNVSFAPLYPGMRRGAVVLADGSGNTLATTYLGGIGNSGLVDYSPGQLTLIGSSLSEPEGIAVDGAGNLFLSDFRSGVIQKIAAGGGAVSTFYTISGNAYDLAIDGAGNLYVPDGTGGHLWMIPPTGASATNITTGATRPFAVAVDMSSNLYVADFSGGAIIKVPAGGGTPVTAASGFFELTGVAVDASGNLYAAESGTMTICKIAAGSGTQTSFGYYIWPDRLATDAAGHVYAGSANGVWEVSPSAGTSAGGRTLLIPPGSDGISLINGVYIDGAGNLYATGSGGSSGLALKLDRSDSPTLDYSPTEVDTVSASQTVAMENDGNQALSFTSISAVSNSAVVSVGSDCSTTSPLAVGGDCNLGIEFAPAATGSPLSGSVALSDNAPNTPQTIALSGNATALPPLVFTAAPPLKLIAGGNAGSVTVSVENGGTVNSGSSAPITLTVTGPSGYDEVYGPTNASSGVASFDLSAVALATAGEYTYTATSTGFSSSTASETVFSAPYGFSNTNVGVTSSTASVTVTFKASGTPETIAVLTQGSASGDFALVSGGSCATGTPYNLGDGCTVNVSFTPAQPGLRMGAVQLADGSGAVLATAFINGIGEGPVLAFTPAVQTTAFNLSGTDSSAVPEAATTDAAGNLYVGYYDNAGAYIAKVTPGGSKSTVWTGAGTPVGLAVDGAGAIYLTLSGNDNLTVIPAGGGAAGTITFSSYPESVAVDGAGNAYVYLANGNVVEIAAESGAQSTVATGVDNSAFMRGIALDSAGNIYLASQERSQVTEIPAGGGSQILLGSSLNEPSSVAVDAAGNVYVAVYESDEIVEIPAGGGSQSVVPFTGLSYATFAVAVDGGGNIYAVNWGQDSVFKLSMAAAPALSFDTTEVGAKSATQSAGVENIGNQPLNFTSISPVSNAALDSGVTTCTTSTPVAVDGSCILGIQFAPATNGTPQSGSVALTDNAAASPQTITLSGNALLAANMPTQLVVSAPAAVEAGLTYNFTVTAEDASGATITGYTGLVAFTSSDPNAIFPANNVTITNGTGSYSFILKTGGSQSITATDSANSLSGSTTVQVDPGSYVAPATSVGSSSATQTATFVIPSAVTLGAINVLTSGASGLDFQVAAGGSCAVSTAYTSGQSCTVNYTFNPLYPGWREGAIQLWDNATPNANLVATVFLSGIGNGPLGVIGTGTTGCTLTNGSDPDGIAVNGAGTMYIAYSGNNAVYKFTSSCSLTQLSTGGLNLSGPSGVALDGAGNLYIADVGNNRAVKVTPAGAASVVAMGSYSFKPFDVAVDGAGNLYMADFWGNRVVEVTAGGAASVLATPGLTLNEPEYLTADGAGNVYISDTGNGRVVEVTAAGAASVVSVPGYTIHPSRLAVDAAGDLYIDDYYNGSYARILMVAPGGAVSLLNISPLYLNTGSIAVDGAGNFYMANNYVSTTFVQVKRKSMSLSFNTTVDGQSSADSPKAVNLQNIGNQPLLLTAMTAPADFNFLGADTTCTASTSLDAGALCVLGVDFAPQSRFYLSESLSVTDNNLGVAGSKQYIYASGTGIGATDALIADSADTPQSAGLNTIFPDWLDVQLIDASNNAISGATITFSAPASGASATLSSTTAVTNSSGWASVSATANNTAGSYLVTATYGSFTATFSLTNVVPPAYTVTTTADDATGVAANCSDQTQNGATLDASCSLRDAIAAASAAYLPSIAPTISFAAALTSSGAATITLGSGGALAIGSGVSMSITGPGASLLTVSGAGQRQVFVNNGGLTLSAITLTNGSGANGGAIDSPGGLTLTNVAVTNSTATNGGGIWNGGTLTLTGSTVSGNTATAEGGGICNSYAVTQTVTTIEVGGTVIGTNTNTNYGNGTATISNSTIANNSATGGLGGGIYNDESYVVQDEEAVPLIASTTTTTTTGPAAPFVSIVNGTLTGNSAGSGGGIYNDSSATSFVPLTVVNSTITGNRAATGGGVAMAVSSLAFQNDIVTGNTATTDAPDVSGGASNGGGNILGDFAGTGTSASAGLAVLGSYGGPAPTMPPLPGSAAICAGLTDYVPDGTTTDARGNPRSTTAYSSTPCVDAGAVQTAYSLSFTAQPAAAHVGVSLTPAPAVQLSDNGAALSLPGAAVTLSPAAGTLSGTLTQNTASTGLATFSGLSFGAIETGETLTASIPASSFTLTAVSSPFDVTIVTVDHYGIVVPASATAGAAFSATVTAYDNTNSVLTSYAGPVTFTSSDAQAVLPGSTSLTSGAATVNVTLKTAGSQTVTVTDGGGSPSAASSPIAVAAATPSAVAAVSGGGQSASIGAAFAQPLKVQVSDAYSNPVSGATVVFSAPASGPSASFATPAATASDGTTSVTATANGTASTTAYSVTASVSGVESSASFTLTNTPAATTLTVAPSATALVYGQPVTISASITPASVLSSAPTGSVSFYDGSTALTPSSTVASAAASYAVSVPAAGSHTYKAQYGGDSNFAASALTSASSAVAVSTASVTLAASSATVTYGQSGSIPVTLTGAYSGAGISVPGGSSNLSYAIVDASSATVASGALTPTAGSSSSSVSIPVPNTLAGGSYTVNVSYGGDGNYSAASTTIALTISPAAQTITFTPPTTPVTFGVSPITLSATATSGLTVVFSVLSGPGSINGSQLTVTGAGTIQIAANQAGNTNYSAAPQVTQSIVVDQESQTITFTPPTTPVAYGVSPITLSATATSGLTVAFSVVSGPGSINGSQLTVTGAGAIQIAANQAGNTNYSAAPQVTQSISVNKASLTATAVSQTLVYGQSIAAYTVSFTGFIGQDKAATSVTGAATFTTSPANPAAIGQYTLIPALGTLASTSYNFSFANGSLTIGTAQAAITGPPQAAQPVLVVYQTTGSIPVTVAGPYSGSGITPPSGLVSYTIGSGAPQTASLSAGSANIIIPSTKAAALYTVTVNYAGDANYSAATALAFQVTVGAQPQTITFNPLADVTYGVAPITLSATATSGLAVTFSVKSGSATLNGNLLTITGAGSVVLAADQAGSAIWKAAPEVLQTLTVNQAASSVQLSVDTNPVLVENPITLTATVSGITTPTGSVSFIDGTATTLGTSPLVAGVAQLTLSTLSVGSHSITAVYSGDTNFLASSSGALTESVLDFTLSTPGGSTTTSGGPAQTVTPGGAATYSLTILPSTGTEFPTPVTLTVSGMPAGATATITPSTWVQQSSNTWLFPANTPLASIAVSIQLPAASAQWTARPGRLPYLAWLLLPFAGILRKSGKRMSRALVLLLLLAAGAAAAGISGCGASGYFGQAQQTYTVTVTATSGALSHSTTIQLTVE